jgi:hypothetical protein
MLALAGAFRAIDAAARCDAGSRLDTEEQAFMSL